MKVSELIAILQSMPQSAEVAIDTHDENGNGEYAEFTVTAEALPHEEFALVILNAI